MAAAKFGNPIEQPSTEREYHRKWVLASGIWSRVAYEYRDSVTIEYRQVCTSDYAVEIIGAPGTGYDTLSFTKVPTRGPFAELVSVWKTSPTLTWTAIT